MLFRVFYRFMLLCLLFSQSLTGLQAQNTPDPELSRKLKIHIENVSKELAKDKTAISISVYRIPDKQEIFTLDADKPLHAASVQKLFITYAALKTLGTDYTIPTEFYSDFSPRDRDPRLDITGGVLPRKAPPEDSLGNLYIRAYGDPVFQYENMLLSARELKARGLNGVVDLVIDDSLFVEETEAAGSASYQAASSATSHEFNAFRVQIVPSASGQSPLISLSPGFYGEVLNRSNSLSGKGESIDIQQSPANDLFPRFVRGVELKPQPILLQVTGRIGLQHPYWEKYYPHPDPFQYYALAFIKALKSEGILVKGGIKRGKVPGEANTLFVHESVPLYSIVSSLNRFSNNFIADQLLYLIGQDQNGFFSKRKGMENMIQMLKEVNAFPDGSVFSDASGLSSENRLTVNQVITLLNEVENDISISPAFISSLSRFGASGTLKDRDLAKGEFEPTVKTSVFKHEQRKLQGVWAKTGTVNGVSGLAGVLERYEGFKIAFAIVLQGEIEKSRAVKIENDIIKVLLGRN